MKKNINSLHDRIIFESSSIDNKQKTVKSKLTRMDRK